MDMLAVIGSESSCMSNMMKSNKKIDLVLDMLQVVMLRDVVNSRTRLALLSDVCGRNSPRTFRGERRWLLLQETSTTSS